MMKQIKQFKAGNKVFAKVKGYPAWPARIDEDQGKHKYRVHFYGTGETGVVKAEDLYLYADFKDQYTKSLKRKDYNDALEEIEAAIKEEGGGDTTTEAETNKSDKVENSEPEPKPNRGTKRKQSLDNSVNENENKAKRTSLNNSDSKKNTPKSKKDVSSPLSEGKANTKKSTPSPRKVKEDDGLDDSIKKNNNTDNVKSSEKKEKSRKRLNTTEDPVEEPMEVDKSAENEELSKYVVVPSNQLQKTIEECSKILMEMDDKEEIDSIPEELTSLESNAILLARVDYGKYIGIKINHNRPLHFKNGSDRLQWAVDNSKRVLDLKEKIELGVVKPEDQPELFELDLELTRDQLESEQDFRIMERKKKKLLWLKIECCLIELDNNIKTSLGLDKAEPDKALKYLDEMLKLTIDPLMLKKHSHVVNMVKRLRRYFGNIKEWKLKERELNDFKKQAEEIRKKAETVYQKFQSLFEIPENTTFSEVFLQQVEKFKSLTKNMTESQVFALCAEPGSKQAMWDELDDQEEVKLMSEKMGTNKDKENISENANFEDVSQILNTSET